ncbi:Endoplasmic Reticulum Oxidoreductin 1 [Aphelenchoides fujianensis]|nr:Endoplasmic Reticulum Oxidoreductin 1 [Aphelenchoides fujianensis]
MSKERGGKEEGKAPRSAVVGGRVGRHLDPVLLQDGRQHAVRVGRQHEARRTARLPHAQALDLGLKRTSNPEETEGDAHQLHRIQRNVRNELLSGQRDQADDAGIVAVQPVLPHHVQRDRVRDHGLDVLQVIHEVAERAAVRHVRLRHFCKREDEQKADRQVGRNKQMIESELTDGLVAADRIHGRRSRRLFGEGKMRNSKRSPLRPSWGLAVVLLCCASDVGAQFASRERAWFCKNSEAVEACPDGEASIDRFNNEQVFPLLQKLLQRDFFKFYKVRVLPLVRLIAGLQVNMERPCPFWPDERECASKECGVEHCDDEVPVGLRKARAVLSVVRFPSAVADKNGSSSAARLANNSAQSVVLTPPHSNRRTTVEPALSTACTSTSASSTQTCSQGAEETAADGQKKCDTGNHFDPLDRSLTEGDLVQLADMESFEDSSDRFCDVEGELLLFSSFSRLPLLDDTSTDMHYVNLAKNPERYTGYKGNSALKVWQSIYQENCFKPDPRFDKDFLLHPAGNTGMCLEKRMFYRLISGLHSAITVSIAAHNYKPAVGAFGTGTWFRNVEMFKGRFGTKWSWEGPERLMNVYFVYLVELRALVKVFPYLQKELFYTGNEAEDAETRQAVEQLIDVCRQYADHYDETALFTVQPALLLSLNLLLAGSGLSSPLVARRVPTALHEHLAHHGLRGLRQVPSVGQTADPRHGDRPEDPLLRRPALALPEREGAALQADEVRGRQDGRSSSRSFRNEVVALFQSFGRYSSSIYEVEGFRKEIFPELPSESRQSHSEL